MLVFREAEKSVFVFFTKEMENLLIVNFKGGYCKKKKIQEIADPFTFVGCCKHDLILNIVVASSEEKNQTR